MKVKSRNRVVISCTSCRRKKIKCDRIKPICSSCKARNYPVEKCIYNDTVDHRKKTSTGAIEKSVVKRIKKSTYNYKNSVLFTKINVSNISTIRLKPNRQVYFGPTCFRSAVDFNATFAQIYQLISKLTTTDRKKYKMQARSLEFSSYFPFNIEEAIEGGDDGQNWVPKELRIDLSGNNGLVESDSVFLNQLVNILPCYDHLKFLVDSFFDFSLDKLYPIVSRFFIRQCFEQVFVFGTRSAPVSKTLNNHNDFTIRIVNRHRDLSILSLILSLLKISLLFTKLPFNSIDPSIPNAAPQKYESVLVYFSKQLLSICKLMKRPLVTTIQALMFLKVNKMFHINESEGGDGSDGYLGLSLIVNMCLLCGIHRDIDVHYKDYPIEYRDMLRKIWKYAMYIDYLQAFDLGYPLQFDDMRFSETSKRLVASQYREEISEFEINRQFKVLNQAVNEGAHIHVILYDYYVPIMRNLLYMLSMLHSDNMSVFKLELYVQNFIHFYCNSRIFQPLHLGLVNPLVKKNQCPDNKEKFIDFVMRTKLQTEVVYAIFTLSNLIFMIMQQKAIENPSKEVISFANFYANQTTNFAILISRYTTSFMEVKSKHQTFTIYILNFLNNIVSRVSSFIYSSVLFSFTTKDCAKQAFDFSNDFDYYWQSSGHIKNIESKDNSFINEFKINSLNDQDFDDLCFGNNRYELLVTDATLQNQFNNYMDFLVNRYVYFNFRNKKKELSNIMFEFFFRIGVEDSIGYKVFYVTYQISLHFYKYLRDRNLVKNFEENEEETNHKSSEKESTPAKVYSSTANVDSPGTIVPSSSCSTYISKYTSAERANAVPQNSSVSSLQTMNQASFDSQFDGILNKTTPPFQWYTIQAKKVDSNVGFCQSQDPSLGGALEYSALDLLNEDFNIDVNDLFNQMSSDFM